MFAKARKRLRQKSLYMTETKHLTPFDYMERASVGSSPRTSRLSIAGKQPMDRQLV